MTIDTIKATFTFAYALKNGNWTVGNSHSEHSRLASIEEQQLLLAHYESIPVRRRALCQNLPYIIFA